ncbi:hypothetical protein O0880_12125 [Janthinobacterium sp. SUN118]|uniref:hypothetical protein n=1 Tax=Janthinobacterium sp. SUN118 TaxID=3004100 RepID=UPI0025B1E22B|nr:hypothetical protein [Janthinobacterium sp. SUN118]MDN2710166.1 hypothetical protein [Janthinobacterium sp. SUN118]
MKHAIACAVLAACSVMAFAADTPSLEGGLLHALQLKKGTTERTGTSGQAIEAYMRAGLVGKKPNRRADYTDYYLLKTPAPFLGHELVLIEEEYITQYIGCCVSPGAGVTVKVHGSTRKLKQFARANRCTLSDHVDLAHELRAVAIRNKVPKGHYASLSCRERDAKRDES